MTEIRLKVTRTIVIEGPESAVNRTLNNSFLQPDKGKVAMPIGCYQEELERVVEQE